MSTRKEVERLKEDLAAVLASDRRPTRLERQLTRREAEQIAAEAAARRKQMRENGMRARLAAHHLPWRIAVGVAIAAGVEWLVRWLFDPLTAVMVAGSAALMLGWGGWMAGRRVMKWRRQIHVAAAAAAVWLVWAAVTGPSWAAAFWWVLGTVACSTRWWKAHRIPHPLAPSRDRVPVPVLDESVPALWDRNLGDQSGRLPGSYLSKEDTSVPKRVRYLINLRAGKQTPSKVLGELEYIAGGLHVPIERVVLEPDPERDPNRVQLTIVEVSPIEQTMNYAGARIAGERRNLIDIGPYGDGDGFAQWRRWTPGEKPMTGSWLSGFIVGGTGIGKSRLMELLAAGYMAAADSVVWFIDPQGGASSPALKEWADWSVDDEGATTMLFALERIAKAREREMTAMKWSRFDPSPERPGIIVFIDECHDIFKKNAKRWAALARKTQKVGIAFVGLTQDASLSSFQEEALRAALLTNAIIMRTESKTQGQLIPGIEVNPLTLPDIPGFGYVLKRSASGRTAPFRSEYLAAPEAWFERYPMPKLDTLSAAAAGDVYQLRAEDAAAKEEETLRWVEGLRNGEVVVEDDEPDLDDEGDDEQGGAFQPPVFPASPFEPRPQDKPADQRILVAVAQGITRTRDIQEAVGLGKSQTAALLRKLVDEQHLEQPTVGVYAIAGSASPPER
jgi:hypothetical protein